jgi:hypothetical protein
MSTIHLCYFIKLTSLHMLALTMDNASASTLAQVVEMKYGNEFIPDHHQIRCLAHVVNLVVQALLANLGLVDHSPEQQDYFMQGRAEAIHYSADDDPEVQSMETAEAAAADAGVEEVEEVEDGFGLDILEQDEIEELGKVDVLTAIKKVSSHAL